MVVRSKVSLLKRLCAATLSLAVLNTSVTPALAMPGWGDNLTEYLWSSKKTAQPEPESNASQKTYGQWLLEGAANVVNYGINGLQKGVSYALHHPGKTLVALLATQAGVASALRPLTDDVLISQNVRYDYAYPSVVDLSNSAFVIWRWANQAGYPDYNIYGCEVEPDGTILNPAFQINQGVTSPYGSDLLALNSSHVFVSWDRNQGGYWDIYGRVVEINNVTFSPNELRINQNAANHQLRPSATVLSDGSIFATYDGLQTGYYYIYGRAFRPEGNFLTNDILISQYQGGLRSSVVTLKDGNAFVGWSDSPARNIKGRVWMPNNTFTGPAFIISQNTVTDNKRPSIIVKDNGHAFVGWSGNTGIYGSEVAPNGTILVPEFRLNQNTTGLQTSVALATWRDHVIAAWEHGQAGSRDVRACVVLPNSTVVVSDFEVNQNTTGDQWAPVLAVVGDKVIFAFSGDQTGTSRIYMRTFDLSDLLPPDPTTAASVQTTAAPSPSPSPVLPALLGVGIPMLGCAVVGGVVVPTSILILCVLKYAHQKKKEKKASGNIYGTPADVLKLQKSGRLTAEPSDDRYGTPDDILRAQQSGHLATDSSGHQYGTPDEILKDQRASLALQQPSENTYGGIPQVLRKTSENTYGGIPNVLKDQNQ